TRVLRKYIGDSFHTTAVEMTTQEFIRSLAKINLENKIRQKIVRFQKYCDPIKYAGILPNQRSDAQSSNDQTIQHDLQLVENLIEQIEKNRVENRLLKDKQIKIKLPQNQLPQNQLIVKKQKNEETK
ncbi:MAG: hypothetical protein L3J69_16700, partial [Desulfobacula sp.]|nr:hypothetical protein [Desulfobacula sp.]